MEPQTKLGAVCALYPMPTTIVGAMADGRPNFLAIAHVGILNNAAPQYLTVSLKKYRHTSQAIRDTGGFSICLPRASMAVVTDYVGIVSGSKVDKSHVFDVFFGTRGNDIGNVIDNIGKRKVFLLHLFRYDADIGLCLQGAFQRDVRSRTSHHFDKVPVFARRVAVALNISDEFRIYLTSGIKTE